MKKIFVFILLLSCLQVRAQNSSADEYFQQAESYFNSGNYDQALKSLNAFVRTLDNDDISGDMAKARALRKKINDCQNIYSKADSCFKTQEYTEALSLYENLQQLNPTCIGLDREIKMCRIAIANTKNSQNAPIHPDLTASSSAEPVYHGSATNTHVIIIKKKY